MNTKVVIALAGGATAGYFAGAILGKVGIVVAAPGSNIPGSLPGTITNIVFGGAVAYLLYRVL